MAGALHHLIPRHLLRGFASRQGRREALTWVYARGKAPAERGVSSVGAVRHFHGDEREPETNADPAVTDFEGRFSGCIHAWRGLKESMAVPAEEPAQLVAHFMVRGNALRGNFQAGIGTLLDELERKVLTGDNLEQMTLTAMRGQTAALREQIRAALPAALPERERAARVEAVLASLPPLVEALSPELRATIGNFLGQFAADLPTIARESHNLTLAQSPAPPLRVEELRRLRWRVEVFGPGALVLGDAGPVARGAGRAACCARWRTRPRGRSSRSLPRFSNGSTTRGSAGRGA